MSKPSKVPSAVSKPKPGTELLTPQLRVPRSVTAASVPPPAWAPLSDSSSPLASSSSELSSLHAAPSSPATTDAEATVNARVRRNIAGFPLVGKLSEPMARPP